MSRFRAKFRNRKDNSVAYEYVDANEDFYLSLPDKWYERVSDWEQFVISDANGKPVYKGDTIHFAFRDRNGDVFDYIGKITFDEYMWLVEINTGEFFSINRVHNIKKI